MTFPSPCAFGSLSIFETALRLAKPWPTGAGLADFSSHFSTKRVQTVAAAGEEDIGQR
jgi:hypothetical protein